MILKRKNVTKRTDDPNKIADLKALGFVEQTRATIVSDAVVGNLLDADIEEEVDLMTLSKKELAVLANVSGGTHLTKKQLVERITGVTPA